MLRRSMLPSTKRTVQSVWEMFRSAPNRQRCRKTFCSSYVETLDTPQVITEEKIIIYKQEVFL